VAPGLFAVIRLDSVATAAPVPPPAVPLPPPPLEQVIVAASRYTLAPADAGATRLDAGTLAAQPQYADDALRVAARLPGVTSNGVTARVNIRGSDADELLLLVDGFPVRQAFHLPALQSPFSTMESSVIANLDVYTGGFPLRYGERMGGVIDLATVDPQQEPRHSISLSNYGVGARTAGVVSQALNLDGLITARAGLLPGLVDRLDTNALTPTFTDGLAKLRWHSGAATSVTAEAMWSRDTAAAKDVVRGEFARMTSRERYFWVHGQQWASEAWRADAWLGYSNLELQRTGQVDNPGVVTGSASDYRTADLWDLRWRVHGALSPRQSLELGGEWQLGDADYSYQNTIVLAPQMAQLYQKPLDSALTTVISPYRRDAALYGAWRSRIGDALTTEWGLRVQRSSGLGLEATWLWDPRAMLSWDVSTSTRLRASWGRFHQTEGAQELDVEDGARGFPAPQGSDQIILGLEHVDTRGINYRAEVFRKFQAAPRPRYENQRNPLSILPELEPDRVRISPDSAELRGLELSAIHAGPMWTWRLGYSWSRASDDIAGTDFRRSWDQAHSFNGTVDWRRNAWTVGAAFTAHTGWPTTTLQYDAAGDPQLGTRNGARWPYFASLDLRASYRQALRRGELLVTLDVTNVFDRRNSCCGELSAPPTGVTVEPLTLLPFTPTLSLRWNF
jgi:outer membrane cobalamin receptor